MKYNVQPPAAELAPFVECLWTLEGNAAELGGAPQAILPDGRPELVLHFGDAFDRLTDDDKAERQPAILFAGQLTSQLRLQPTGRIAIVGVRLRGHGASALFRDPLDQLAGMTIGVDAISRPLARCLLEVRESSATLEEATGDVQRRLAAFADPSRIDPVVRFAVEAIQVRSGLVSIEQLARAAGTTRRHLERRFRAAVGIPPKRLARIARLQRAIQMLEGLEARNKGAIAAAECGYADQAHFVRDCRELCGQAPAALLEQRAQLTGFFLASPAA